MNGTNIYFLLLFSTIFCIVFKSFVAYNDEMRSIWNIQNNAKKNKKNPKKIISDRNVVKKNNKHIHKSKNARDHVWSHQRLTCDWFCINILSRILWPLLHFFRFILLLLWPNTGFHLCVHVWMAVFWFFSNVMRSFDCGYHIFLNGKIEMCKNSVKMSWTQYAFRLNN